MAQLIYAWELGGQLGHLGKAASIAPIIEEAGHGMAVVGRDLARAHDFEPLRHLPLFQAPVWFPRVRKSPGAACSTAEILPHVGYLSAERLTPLVRAWMGLFEALSADAVIADYAPTAELAALCLGLPRMSIGHGFYPPPTDNRPIPPFMPGGASAAQRSDLESRIDRTLAGVGRRLGVEATLNLGKLLTPDELALTTIPELDFYRRPSTEDYLGLLPGSTATVPAASPRGEVTFVYLHATHPATRPVLDALRGFDAPVVACLPGADAKLLQSLREQGVTASTRPHDLDSIEPQCRLAVTHGGLGTVLRFALHGCGQVAVPTQPEQRTMAQRMAEAGIGRVLPRVPEAEALQDTLEQAAGYTGGSAARQFVAQHRWAHPPQSTERFRAMVARLAGSD